MRLVDPLTQNRRRAGPPRRTTTPAAAASPASRRWHSTATGFSQPRAAGARSC